MLVSEAQEANEAPETQDAIAPVDTSTGLDCDESEIVEMHRNDVRRLLAEGLRNPNEPI